MGIDIKIDGVTMQVNGQDVDMQDSKIARKYGISDSGSIRPLSEEDRAEMARDKAEREANKKQRQTRQDTRSYSAKGNSEARIFGLTAEQLANDEPLKINGNGNIKVSMKNVKIGDTVTAGQLLGTVAEPTAYYKEEGPGIYFAMTKDGIPVNPMDYLGE